MPDNVITSSSIARAFATALRMFFERPDELIATRQSPARAFNRIACDSHSSKP